MNGNIIEREIRKRHLFPSRVTFNQTEKDDHFRKRCNDLQIGIVGTQDVSTEGFKEFSGALMQKVSGIQSVWLLIKGEGIAIDWFGFE